jgi:hypothetical protein
MKGNISMQATELHFAQQDSDNFLMISDYDALRPFLMSIVSDSDHWMFIASNGGLTAGRKNAEHALFPYYTDDKLSESTEITGSKSIFLVRKDKLVHVWEPFSNRYDGLQRISRNLYKNTYGNKIRFEEINHDLGLTFRYEWNSSDLFGFVRTSKLINNGATEVKISLLDGIQNIMPHGVSSDLQNSASNLVDAYKRSELDRGTGLGLYALSAIIVDKAEPSEALKANVVWSVGLENPTYLLSSLQLREYRRGLPVRQEEDVKGEKGVYFLVEDIALAAKAEKDWRIIANVNQNHSAIAKLRELIKNEKQLDRLVQQDVEAGTKRLIQLNAAADALQLTADKFRDTRHYSNVLFNIMRGGIFDDNYQIEKWDFTDYLSKANRVVFENAQLLIAQLPAVFSLTQLKALTQQSEDVHFKRLCLEYLPLKFSRRHGDPSRPWNRFSINMRNEKDGSKILDYQGNWRDIFQNWEALAVSYPEFVESMVHKFLNATTFDGYNPYRVTKDGFDWETIEPDNPWSYIGYWGDHQIIYLLKLLEIMNNHFPGKLGSYFDQELFVYANVPYKIKSHADILKNPKDTITFDHKSDRQIRKERETLGADAALLRSSDFAIITVNFLEKILATVLAKLSNFIPEAGIWMNTQRPEWNDANNALVGNGVSMVTLCYLRRFLFFFKEQFSDAKQQQVMVSSEIADFFNAILDTLEKNRHLLEGKISNKDRKRILDGLGKAGSDFRETIYNKSFCGRKESVSWSSLRHFTDLGLQFIDHSIRANKRPDNLYHAYNLMTLENESEISIAYLSEMLEGQVAVLCSGYLSSQEALDVLIALRKSKLYRQDQNSYLLYPDKDLPHFLDKNTIPEKAVSGSVLLTRLVADGNLDIIEKDVNGIFHFNGNFKNAADLAAGLEELMQTKFAHLVENEKRQVLQIFEEVFNHKAFTGRSGTFYGYEGLGSIYWHMVSKLQLAAMEVCQKAVATDQNKAIIDSLSACYYEINEGIGIHKSPSVYGAFPTDPYSHTPAGRGAQQPGMTGQVKEDILSRMGELGVSVRNGQLNFYPALLRRQEFLTESRVFDYVDVKKQDKQLSLEKDSICFTYCQVPVVYKISPVNGLTIFYPDGASHTSETTGLDAEASRHIFGRTGTIERIEVNIKQSKLR